MMDASMYRYMDVGLIHFMAYPQTIKGDGPVLETVRQIAEDDYFTFIEITWIKDPAVRNQVRDMLNQAGMKVAFAAQPALLTQKLSLNTTDETERRRAVEQVKACIDEAYFMGACGLAVLAGRDPGEASRPAEKKLLVSSLKEICRYSALKGDMPVVLETFDRVPFGKNCIIGPTREAAEIAAEVRSECPNFGLMIDLSHLPLLSESAMESLTLARDYLMHVHIGNCVMRDPAHPAYGDEHPRFGIEGGENGVRELADFLRALIEIGYLKEGEPKPVSFEVKPIAAIGETSAIVVANAKRTLNQAWAMV